MTRHDYLILFLVGIIVALIAAVFEPVPGYMDAEYYYASGLQIASGNGFFEPFLWNYLDDPAGIPHPSHTYWMPFAAVLAAAGMFLTGLKDFLSARLVFIILAGLLPGFAAFISYRLTGKRIQALLAGAFALFPGFYLIYNSNTETFTLYMLLGALIILVAFSNFSLFNQKPILRYLFLGVLAGLMHLCRADGFIWLIPGILLVVLSILEEKELFNQSLFSRLKQLLVYFLFLFAGYMLIMLPWYWRNFSTFGSLFPPGNSLTLWMTHYDELFVYPASRLNYASWIASGWSALFLSRLNALMSNLQTALAVQGEIFLFPLILIGLGRLRKDRRITFIVIMYMVTLINMSILFPFSGSRGGFLHSGAAFQLFFWAVAPAGLEWLVNRLVRWRGLEVRKAMIILGGGLVLISAGMTCYLFFQRVIGSNLENPTWAQSHSDYLRIELELEKRGVSLEERVMVNNPPGYYLASGRQCLVIPDGSLTNVINAGKRYEARYLILDKNFVEGLKDLYFEPFKTYPGVTYITTISGAHIFRLD